MLGPHQMVNKTVILMDHRTHMSELTDQKIVIEDLTATKTRWTVVMEATVEYTRILLDVCRSSHPVLVMAADEELSILNNWKEQSGITEMVKTLAMIGPPKDHTQSEQPDLSMALQECVDVAMTNSALDTQQLLLGHDPAPHRARIACFTSLAKPQQCVDIVREYHANAKAGEGEVHMTVFNLSDTDSMEQVNAHDQIYNVRPGNLFKTVLDTVLKYHNLTITTITSIPMKEEQSTNTQAAAYNVDIVHPVIELPCCSKERLTMKWCSPKNAQNINLSNCVATYPVTPLDVAERPTICLVNFLLVGKQVVLEYPNSSMSVVLINHGGTIVMHYIANSKRTVLDHPTPIIDTPGGKVSDYRVEELGKHCIENLTLCPHPPPASLDVELPVHRSLLELERVTACFPLTYSTSPLDSCGLNNIFNILSKDTLSDREVTECQQVIYRVQGIEVKKEPISFKCKTGKRDSAVQELWAELERLVVSLCHVSSQHGKVRDCLYKIRGCSFDEESLYLSKAGVNTTTHTNTAKRGADSTDSVPSEVKPVVKCAKLSQHPSVAGDRISLLSLLPKVTCKEFVGALNGVTGPEQLYAELQQKKHLLLSGMKKSGGAREGGSPSPHCSPRSGYRANDNSGHR